jgi:hypothetical protein
MLPPSRTKFDKLSLQDRLGIIVFKGHFIASRTEEEDTVYLYHMGSYFTEIFYDAEGDYVHYCRTMVQVNLDLYASYVELPSL